MVNPASVVDQEIPKSKSSSPESQARDDNYKEEENKKVEEVDKAGEGDGEEEEEEEENRQIVRRLPEQQQQQQQQQGGGGGGGTPSLDPNQTYILAGPYARFDPRSQSYVNFFSARPVPKGMTVIASPLMTAAYPNASNVGAPSASRMSMLQTFTARAAAAASSSSASSSLSPSAAASPYPSCPPSPGPGPGPSAPAQARTQSSTPASSFNPDAPVFVPKKTVGGGEGGAKKRAPCFMYWSPQHPEGALIPLRQPQPPVYFPT